MTTVACSATHVTSAAHSHSRCSTRSRLLGQPKKYKGVMSLHAEVYAQQQVYACQIKKILNYATVRKHAYVGYCRVT